MNTKHITRALILPLTLSLTIIGVPSNAAPQAPKLVDETRDAAIAAVSIPLTTDDGETTETAESGLDLIGIERLDEAPAPAPDPAPSPAPSAAVEEDAAPTIEVVGGGTGSMGLVRSLPQPGTSTDSVVITEEISMAGLPEGEPELAPATSADDLVVLTEALQPGEFGVAALTWPAGEDIGGAQVNFRVMENGEWSRWLDVEPDNVGREDEARSGTEAFLTGVASEIQVQINATRDELPADLRLEIMGFDGEGLALPGPNAGGMAVGFTPAPSTIPGDPGVISRAQWGAEPLRSTWKPQIVTLEGAVIHHTAGTNTYTAAQSAGLVRNIHHYHAITRGWGDIGYNFLVDKYGQIFEGRDGSLSANWWQMPVGAHAAPRNTNTMGVSVMGNFTDEAPPQAAYDAMTKIVDWRFEARGIDGNSTHRFTDSATPAQRIIGHRDVAATVCPGPFIQAWLPTLRANVGEATYHSDFFDVRPWSSSFVPEINWMKSAGISTGWTDGTFRPHNTTTRGEMAAFLYRVAGHPAWTAPAASPFLDLKSGDAFYHEITWLASTGITTGWKYSNGTQEFRPWEPVMRDQMAAFLFRLSKQIYVVSATEVFRDVPTSHPFHAEISWLASTGITTGWSDGTFRPGQAVTREELSAFLTRYAGKF